MKKINLSIMLLALFSATVFAGGKDKTTFKETIESSNEVKVYFNLTEMVDREAERKMKQTNPSAQTDVRSAIPVEFASEELMNSVVTTLNTELQVSNFKVGNVSELGKSDDKQTQFLDLSKLSDGVVAIIQIEGDYTRFVDMAKAGEVSNSVEIKANMFFYEITGGVAKKIKVNMGMGANLGTTRTETIKTPSLTDLSWFEINLPVSSLLDNYSKTMKEYAGDFAARMLKKHTKELSKR